MECHIVFKIDRVKGKSSGTFSHHLSQQIWQLCAVHATVWKYCTLKTPQSKTAKYNVYKVAMPRDGSAPLKRTWTLSRNPFFKLFYNLGKLPSGNIRAKRDYFECLHLMHLSINMRKPWMVAELLYLACADKGTLCILFDEEYRKRKVMKNLFYQLWTLHRVCI